MVEQQPEHIFNEFQMRASLFKVRSRLNEKTVFQPVYKKKIRLKYVDGKPVISEEKILDSYIEKKFKSNYKEPLNEDLSTAFLTNDEKILCLKCLILMEKIKAFANRKGLDMSNSYNFFCNIHDYLVVSSKATGEGARISSQQQTIQKYQVSDSRLLPSDEAQGEPVSPHRNMGRGFDDFRKKFVKKRNFDSLI